MGDFLLRGYNNVREIVSERDKMIDIQGVVKIAGDDGVVTYDEIRDSLRRYSIYIYLNKHELPF